MSRKCGVLCMAVVVVAIAGLAYAEPPLAEVSYLGSGVEFSPRAWGHGFTLTVMAPDGAVVEKIVKDGAPSFDLSELKGPVVDGRYRYELRLIVSPPRGQKDNDPLRKALQRPRIKVPSLSGSFVVAAGSIVTPEGRESKALSAGMATPQGGPDTPDVEIPADLCIGTSCVSGETFNALSTLKLKELDTGIHFDDTDPSTYPNHDWLIYANDWYTTGNNYMAIQDLTSATTPFKVMGGASNDTLIVDANGRVGINTSIPGSTLYIADSSPVMTLYNTSGTPQRWDVLASYGYFGIFDVTNNRLGLVIEPNGPLYNLFLKADGKVGVGTNTPTYQFEVWRSGVNSNVVVTRSGGAQNYINATASFGNFGTVSNHPLRLVVNSTWQMRINNDSSIAMANGASLTAGGVWTNASSRALKQDIEGLSIEEAKSALADLEPVKFAYKANGERHVGFIAEDVPDLVVGADRNGLSPMDVVAVLTRVVQELQQLNEKQLETNNQLRARISTLESR